MKQVARTKTTSRIRTKNMANQLDARHDPNPPALYQIIIKGHLDRRWTEWFAGFTITHQKNGETLLTGPVVDQADLYGLLRKVRDLGLPLLTVRCLQSPQDRRS
jgi:hypothetical protein